MNVVDFLPRPNNKAMDAEYHAQVIASKHTGDVTERSDLKKWLVRRVECMRGEVDVNVEVCPAFSKFIRHHYLGSRSLFRRLRTRQTYD